MPGGAEHPTQKQCLSLEVLAMIAAAAPTATPVQLARELGVPAYLVGWHLRRFRQRGGWYSDLKLPPCTECDQPVVGPPKQITHIACLPARKARWVREKRHRFHAEAPSDAREAQRRRELQHATRYFHALPPERKAALFEKWQATVLRDYEITREVADSNKAPWTEDDDCYLLANEKQAARELALALGRTSWAVYRRRSRLRHQRALEAEQASSPAETAHPVPRSAPPACVASAAFRPE